MADLGEGPGGPAPPLFLDQTEKIFFGDRASPLSQGLDDRLPPFPPPPLSECQQCQQHVHIHFQVFEGIGLVTTDPSTLHSESDSHNYIITSN